MPWQASWTALQETRFVWEISKNYCLMLPETYRRLIMANLYGTWWVVWKIRSPIIWYQRFFLLWIQLQIILKKFRKNTFFWRLCGLCVYHTLVINEDTRLCADGECMFLCMHASFAIEAHFLFEFKCVQYSPNCVLFSEFRFAVEWIWLWATDLFAKF